MKLETGICETWKNCRKVGRGTFKKKIDWRPKHYYGAEIQRAVNKLITLLKKVCCQVSRCLSVMLEHGDWFLMSLDHSFQTSEKIHVATQKMGKSGFFWNDKKEQIHADKKAEIQKHEFQADYDRRNIQKLNWVIESQRGEINRALGGDEQLRRYQQLLHAQLLEQNRELREAHEKSLNDMKELKRFQGSTFETLSRRKIHRRSRHYPWTHRQDSGITEWSQLYECLKRFFWGCRVSTQWTIPRSQSTSVTSTLSWSRRIAKPQQSAARYFELAGFFGERFCKSTSVFFVTLSRRIQSLDFSRNGRHITACNEWTSDSRHSLGSEIPANTVSQKFIRP